MLCGPFLNRINSCVLLLSLYMNAYFHSKKNHVYVRAYGQVFTYIFLLQITFLTHGIFTTVFPCQVKSMRKKLAWLYVNSYNACT